MKRIAIAVQLMFLFEQKLHYHARSQIRRCLTVCFICIKKRYWQNPFNIAN